VCTLAVIYEDPPTRDLGIRVCDRLFQDFQGELDFEITWWGARYMSEGEIARAAAAAAAGANIVVVCFQPEGEFALDTRAWFESWTRERQLPEGALVAVGTPREQRVAQGPKELFLRSVAERAALEFLAPAPQGEAASLAGAEGIPFLRGAESESTPDQRYWGW